MYAAAGDLCDRADYSAQPWPAARPDDARPAGMADAAAELAVARYARVGRPGQPARPHPAAPADHHSPGAYTRAATQPAGTARAGALLLPLDAAPRRRWWPTAPRRPNALRVQRNAGAAPARGAARYRRADRC